LGSEDSIADLAIVRESDEDEEEWSITDDRSHFFNILLTLLNN